VRMLAFVVKPGAVEFAAIFDALTRRPVVGAGGR
jgi:hypothetical protein